MKNSRDPDVLIRHFLEQGIDELPERSYDAVRSRIDHTRQRIVIGPWREEQLLKYASLTGAAAAVVLIAVFGTRFLPTEGGFGGQPSPTPSPTPISDPLGRLEPGPYVAHPFANDPLGFAFTVPSGNWESVSDPGQMLGVAWVGATGTPYGRDAGLGFLHVHSMNGEPCKWSGDADDIVSGPTVDDLIAVLASSTHYEATEPVVTTVSGFSGKYIRLTMPATGFAELDSAAINCDEASFRIWNADGFDIYAQGASNIWDVNVIDVHGDRVVILATYFDDSGARTKAELQQMVDSVQISP